MLKRMMHMVLFAAVVSILLWTDGCSKKDNNPVQPTDHKVDIRLKPGTWLYNRWDLDSSNVKIDASLRQYNLEFRGNGGLYQGAYNDWYYRIGTDMKSGVQDTLLIRTDPNNSDVMVYAFQYTMLSKFVDMVMALVPGITRPAIPPAQWDVIGSYTGTAGQTTWAIGDPQGTPLNFNFSGIPVTVLVTLSGKYEKKEETITVGAKTVTAWETSVTAALDILGTRKNLHIYFWFSDNPSTQIKVVQESLVMILPFLGKSDRSHVVL